MATSSRGEVPGCRAVIVTGHGRTGHRERAREVTVRGFVPTAVSVVVAGRDRPHGVRRKTLLGPELAAEAIGAGGSPPAVREGELGECAVAGAAVTEIGRRASPSPGTVRECCSAASVKPGAENCRAAARLTCQRGWL
ncbi:hypothetical protein IPZ61_06300 [Streptomyces sioyaensis]|uniref:hypothetical protein n=1 Tax=Streptomyces sioyaensis TaxID=67364 RepID=UPI001F2FE769|nr:hypothetical protein [Streptomyces sioyaensis]MCF3172924.1 hypothetical protein [Streptomyces sioyaensis]